MIPKLPAFCSDIIYDEGRITCSGDSIRNAYKIENYMNNVNMNIGNKDKEMLEAMPVKP
jgi:hypothetical protein